MADSHPPQSTNAPAAKSRNPVERLIVWGLIGALLIAVAIEFQSRSSHQNVLAALLGKVKAVDQDSTKPEVTEAVVKEVVGDRKPTRTEDLTGGQFSVVGAKRLEVYSWFTLNPTSKREIWVFYGGKGKDSTDLATVIEVRTSETVDEPPEVAAAGTVGDAANPPAGGPGMGGPGGMGGGGMGMGGGRSGGGRRGRPGAVEGAENADKTDDTTADADTPDADKPSEEKPAADKPDADKPSEEKAATEKPADEKTEKSETDNE